MRYLIPLFDCVLCAEKNISLNKFVQYYCENVDNKNIIVIGKNNEIPFSFNFVDEFNSNVEKVQYRTDEFYFLKTNKNYNQGFYQFKYQNKQICVALFEKLIISIDGETILNEKIENITYSHFEVKNQMCFIYFSGKRNYIVVLQNSEVKISSFYDEVNILDNEFYFMNKLNDSLNHGKVFHIKDKNVEDYLVYLDDADLNLKTNFVATVFLDCVLAGNFDYANNLLCKDLKQNESENISKFFASFDNFVPINETEFLSQFEGEKFRDIKTYY